MNSKPKPTEDLNDMVDEWNADNPVGTPVMRYKLINPLREGRETVTTSEAWLMGGHSVMVMVEGASGGVALESVVPLIRMLPRSALSPGQVEPERPECKAVTWGEFTTALDVAKPGECIELHHPEADGTPTPMGHCVHTKPDGSTINLWAGCWGRKDDGTVVWTYSVLGINELIQS